MERIVPKDTMNIIKQLQDAGYEAYLIGGACRDILFDRHKVFADKKIIKDFDIVTSATPQQLSGMFMFDNLVTCGNNFLVTLIDGIEVATYRKDKSDNAEVAHTLKEDVARRDFTINAIAYDVINKEIIDHTQGVIDLDNRVLRFIGEPCRRIEEDPIRILRGLRFASQYNLEIEKETYFAMFQHRNLLKYPCGVPAERIQQEVMKAFSHNNTHRFLTLLRELEMLEIVFPCLTLLENKLGGKYHNETVLSHSFNAVKAIDDSGKPILKLSALYHDIGKYEHSFNLDNEITFKGHNCRGAELIEKDLKEHLKFSNDIVEYVQAMAKVHMDCFDTKKSVRKVLVKLKANNIDIRDLCLLRYADNKANVREHTDFMETWSDYKFCLKVINEKPPFSPKSIDVTGQDIMDWFGLPQCKEVGDLIKKAFEAIIEGDLANDRASIFLYLKGIN